MHLWRGDASFWAHTNASNSLHFWIAAGRHAGKQRAALWSVKLSDRSVLSAQPAFVRVSVWTKKILLLHDDGCACGSIGDGSEYLWVRHPCDASDDDLRSFDALDELALQILEEHLKGTHSSGVVSLPGLFVAVGLDLHFVQIDHAFLFSDRVAVLQARRTELLRPRASLPDVPSSVAMRAPPGELGADDSSRWDGGLLGLGR